jgi:hypothetical protein
LDAFAGHLFVFINRSRAKRRKTYRRNASEGLDEDKSDDPPPGVKVEIPEAEVERSFP